MSSVSLLGRAANIAARWSLAEEAPVPYNFTLITLIPASPQEMRPGSTASRTRR